MINVMKNMAVYAQPEIVAPLSETYMQGSILNLSKVEYVDIACNYVQGCSHNCPYCYAKDILKRRGKPEDWTNVKISANALEMIAKKIPYLKPGTIPLFSLMSDPFMVGRPDICSLTLQGIKMLNDAGFNCATLTKGILPVQDLLRLSHYNVHGISLSSLNEDFRMRYEPGAAPYAERIAALWALKCAGLRVWVSMEPYFTPNILEQDLHQVLSSISFVDYLVFGRVNHWKEASEYPGHKQFYNQTAAEVMAFCQAHNIVCHIKEGTITC